MREAEKAYQDWVDEGDNRYGSVHRKAFEAGYEKGYVTGNQAAVQSRVTKFIDAHMKPWVGLTDEEWRDLYVLHHDRQGFSTKDYGKAIEAKLKEKNSCPGSTSAS